MEESNLLGEMKKFEIFSDLTILSDCFFAIRVDGRSFHTEVKKMKMERPFDKKLRNAINKAVKSVMKDFGCLFAYTESDEVTFSFPNAVEDIKGYWDIDFIAVWDVDNLDEDNYTIYSCDDFEKESCDRMKKSFDENGCVYFEGIEVCCATDTFDIPYIKKCFEIPLWRYVNDTKGTWRFPEDYFEEVK